MLPFVLDGMLLGEVLTVVGSWSPFFVLHNYEYVIGLLVP